MWTDLYRITEGPHKKNHIEGQKNQIQSWPSLFTKSTNESLKALLSKNVGHLQSTSVHDPF